MSSKYKSVQEWDIGYFDKIKTKRTAIPQRSIKQRLIAWELDERYYDGHRDNGYGGFSNDGRWDDLVIKLQSRYKLNESSCIVDLGCKKGFILESVKKALPNSRIIGIENHPYPIKESSPDIRDLLLIGPYWNIPLENSKADLVIAFSSIYMQSLGEVVKTLREIERVSNGNSYITLGAYQNDYEKKIFENWTLIGTTVMHVDDWYEVMEYAGYTGDVFFTTPSILGLI
jgi:hypothetical protein